MAKIFLGMGIQAACTAALVAFGIIKATTLQQAIAAVIFLVFALLYSPNSRRKVK
jgi:hypothetical protein